MDIRILENVFEKTFSEKSQFIEFTPYRICPVGAHVDHHFGKVTGFAIDKGVYIAFSPAENTVIKAGSMQFGTIAEWDSQNVPPKQNDWADLLRGATSELAKNHPLKHGLKCLLCGEMPVGGLSSSAAVVICLINALCKVNGIHIDALELIDTAQKAENYYVGVMSGKLDQCCEVYCKKDKLLYMDMKTGEHFLAEPGETMKPFSIAVFFSGIERNLASSDYNMRVRECCEAAYILKKAAGFSPVSADECRFRDVTYDEYLQYKNLLPEKLLRRAEHWYGECGRVELAVEAWQNGDIERFGEISTQSGISSIENYEAGSAELKKLCEIMWRTHGIYGGRFSGAGFKGCCMAVIDPQKETSVLETVENEYLAAFPHLKGKFSAHICHTADGVNV